MLLLLWLYASSSVASHMMGGEVTWKCLSNGQYVFTVKVYRDCTGATISTTGKQLRVYGIPGLTFLSLSFVGSPTDVSPNCYNPSSGLVCGPLTAQNSLGSISQYTFESSPIFLSGIPPVAGWHFVYTENTRNGAISNYLASNGTAISNSAFAIRASMYRYIPPGSSTPLNASQCYDSSPEFLEIPAKVICTGKPYLSNNIAIDANLDSLHYSFAEPVGNAGTSNVWPIPSLVPATGFSATSPFPGPAQNPQNQAAVLDVKTGVISLENNTQGNFLACIAVESWRCGQLISIVYRDVQLTYLGMCSSSNNVPIVNVISTGLNPQGNGIWTDTVVAGSLVQFTIQAADFDLHDTANAGTFQYVSFEAFGNQFGSSFTNPQAGCNEPPCATLSPSPLIAQPFANTLTFSWQTECYHAIPKSSCFSNASITYDFVFRVLDDACPVPSEQLLVVRITILADTAGPSLLVNGPTSLCTGQDVSISIPNPSSTASYQWCRNSHVLQGQNLPQITVSETGTYFVLINDNGYCYMSGIVSVVNHGIPSVGISNAPEFVCESSGVNIYAFAPGATSYQWLLNGTPIPSANQIVLTIYQGGDYSIISYSPGGCSDTSAVYTILGVPGIYIDSIAGPKIVNPNQVYTYSVPYIPDKTYTWSLSNGFLVSGQATNNIQAYWFGNQLGSLFLVVHDGPCIRYFNLYVQGYISVEEMNQNEFAMFPNPSQGVFRLVADDEPSCITIIDELGREVLMNRPMSNEFEIDISHLSDGVYFLRMQIGQHSSVQKLIKTQ